jgi:hypothetical protein
VGDLLREGAPRGGRRDGEVGDRDDGLEVLRFEAHRAHAFGGEGADDETAEQGRGGVVGVAVELADDVEEVGGGDLAAEEVVRGDGTAHQRRGAPAQTPDGWDGVLLDEAEVGVGLADELGDEAGRAVGGVIRAAGDKVGAGAANLHDGIRGSIQADPHA